MQSDSSVMKWAAGVLLVIVVCFCLGYFVLGPSSRFGQRTAASVNGGDGATVIERSVLPSPGSGIEVKDRTSEIEAARRKAEEERKKRAEEEKKKREEEEEKRKREEEERENALPSPTASATPDPDDLPVTASPSPPAVGPDEEGEPAAARPPRTAGPDTPVTAPNSVPVAAPAPMPSPLPPRETPPPAPPATRPGNSTPPAAAPPTAGAPPAGPLFRVRVGTFAERENAQNLATELNGRGYQASIQSDRGANGKTVYRLQVGAYRDEKNAREIVAELKANGYDATLSRG
ncbi:MAG TPA: SPOR domain-containing protein [Armatimonadaceae bacterium]|nr:SPOR domain-containing protein [Armatimonadaceae bacterium]